ncbi:MAG: type III-A CRISPR-associated RAMP protein Csm4 [Candidatus Marinimicrobia bacterium]|nr:type III-A CRISPR-associated RAMP protein Csm4 [Candidatus Neomarinimicrobiota bacterium]
MELSYYKLKFTSPLHIGTNRPGFEFTDEILHSDTLFSAVINMWALLYPGDMALFLPGGGEDSLDFPWFQVSSAFPYQDSCFYFPKPFVRLNTGDKTNQKDPRIAKKIKQLKYLDQTLFEKAIHNEEIRIPECSFSGNGQFLNAESGQKRSPDQAPFAIYDVPRVVKDRRSGSTMPFSFTRICFQKKAGLWFAATFSEEQWAKRFRAALNLLGDTGIGGDRSVGHGQFSVADTGIMELKVPADTRHCLTLSLYHPKTAEIPAIREGASYQIIERKGWIFAGISKPLRRQAVRMFKEGSVFGNSPSCGGDVVKVLDKDSAPGLDHHIYRYGIAFPIPCRAGGK